MLAITRKTTHRTLQAAIHYLHGAGYQQVNQCWLRGQRHSAVMHHNATGRVIICEGVAA